MAVLNTTYNFREKNPNFIEGIAIGALGTMTGGMGMNGSVWNMSGMYNIGCGTGMYGASYDAYIENSLEGELANLTTNVIIGGINSAVQKKANKQSLDDKIGVVESNAEKYLAVLGSDKTLETFNRYDSAEEYGAVVDLQSKVDEASTQLGETKKAKQKAEIEFKCLKEPEKSNYTDTEQFQKDMAAYIEAKDNLESLEKQVEKEEKALEAAEKARDAKKEEVQKAIDALIPLKDEYDKLVEQKRNEDNAKILDKADGNWINRASKKSIEGYTGKNEDGKPAEATKAQIRGAFNQFINAQKSDDTEKMKFYAKILKTMRENSPKNFEASEKAYKILNIEKYAQD